MASLAEDYWKIRAATEAVRTGDFATAKRHFETCRLTAKVAFNLAVLEMWTDDGKQTTTTVLDWLRRALRLDSHFSCAAFYLASLLVERGEYTEALDALHVSLCGFRSCDALDYTAIGMPFVLTREDVHFNIASLHRHLHSETSEEFVQALRHLSLDSIRSLLACVAGGQMHVPPQDNHRSGEMNVPPQDDHHSGQVHVPPWEDYRSGQVHVRVPPWDDRRMLFHLLPRIEPENVELRGPEFISLVEGEHYATGFDDAAVRSTRMELFEHAENSEHVEFSESVGNAEPVELVPVCVNGQKHVMSRHVVTLDALRLRFHCDDLYFLDGDGRKLLVYNERLLQYALQHHLSLLC